MVCMPKPLPRLLNLQSTVLKKGSPLQLGIAFGSGILMALAVAPLNAFPLAWIALAPLWVLVFGDRHPSHLSHSNPYRLALVWGIGYHGLALSWITGLHPLTWLGMSWPASVAVALFCWAFITLWGAMLVVIWVWLVRKLTGMSRREKSEDQEEGTSKLKTQNSKLKTQNSPSSPYAFILIATAFWCSLEWFWSLGSLYWTSLSFTQSPGNLVILHLGQLSGPAMVTAAIVIVNGLIAEAWIRYQSSLPTPPTPHSLLLSTLILLFTLHLVGYGLYSQPLNPSSETALKVGIVQGNVPTRIKLSAEGIRRAVKRYVSGYEKLAGQGVDAVLTPEGALPVLWDGNYKQQNLFYQAVREQGVVAWLGTFVPQNGRITQSLITLTGQGEIFSRYNKIKLVPLGEYVPFREVLGGLIDRLSPIEADMLAGSGAQRFDTPFGRAIASICYESAFPELFRAQAADGGQFILTASNLDPYSEVLMAQHQAQDLMRAIETDRWAVRATNTGYSGIIDPHGRILWISQPKAYEIHAATIYRRQRQTFYVRWGDWLTPLLVGMAAITWLFSGRFFG